MVFPCGRPLPRWTVVDFTFGCYLFRATTTTPAVTITAPGLLYVHICFSPVYLYTTDSHSWCVITPSTTASYPLLPVTRICHPAYPDLSFIATTWLLHGLPRHTRTLPLWFGYPHNTGVCPHYYAERRLRHHNGRTLLTPLHYRRHLQPVPHTCYRWFCPVDQADHGMHLNTRVHRYVPATAFGRSFTRMTQLPTHCSDDFFLLFRGGGLGDTTLLRWPPGGPYARSPHRAWFCGFTLSRLDWFACSFAVRQPLLTERCYRIPGSLTTVTTGRLRNPTYPHTAGGPSTVVDVVRPPTYYWFTVHRTTYTYGTDSDLLPFHHTVDTV